MNTDMRMEQQPINIFEMEAIAKATLPQMTFDYYVSGANDEITVRENHAAYERIFLNPHMLIDVSSRDLSTEVLGIPISFPVITAPTAFQRLAHADGEIATARAAGKLGTIMTLSTLSNSRVEEVVAAASGPIWFQLYVYKDREVTRSLVERAESAGCKALVLTVDAPMLGRREADVRNRFQLPHDLALANLVPDGLQLLPSDVPDSGLAAYIVSLIDPALTWRDLEWLRGITKLPILVKGILRADDAKMAVEHGASGIVVSNHGGRQLDTTPATILALPRVVDAVAGSCEILIDGGIRRGTDVIKALAYGVKAVLVGRPIVWGLSFGGEQGVTLALETLRSELDLAMALCGVTSISKITRDLIFE